MNNRAQSRNTVSRGGARMVAVVGAFALVASAASTSPAWALAVTQAYILSGWSSPTTATGAPFTLNGTAGFSLGLNGSGVATSATALSGSLPIEITDRLYYQSHYGTVDPGEVSSSQLANRVNYEIRRLDDAGIVNESVDAPLNIDFTNNSAVTLRTAANVSVPGLVIFEDAGLDPFSLRYCYNVSCSNSSLLFNGFNTSTRNTLLASGGFGTDDSAPGIDQAFWFIFDQTVTGGYFKIGESVNFGSHSEMLEVDFVGVTRTPARVPEPSTLLLLGSGLMGLPLLRKLRSR